MKFLNKFIIATAALLSMSVAGCSDDVPDYSQYPSKDVDFTYNVDDDEYKNDYYVVSHVRFNNISSKTGAVHWDFGDGETSTDPNPVHKFAKAGVYRVTLTVDGAGSQTYPILIYDIVPVLTVAEQSTEIVEFNNTKVSFNIELPNPENLKVRYEWTFPEGTTDANGNTLTSFTGYSDAEGNIEYPGEVKFANIGSQRIQIASWFDLDGENRRLEDTYLNVQVGTQEPAPTLYYAERAGNIKAYKLVDTTKLPKGTKVYPFDMGVSAGQNAFNLVYADVAGQDEEGNANTTGWVYILDAGKQYYFINDPDGVMGDGLINAMRTDGTGVNTVITNVGGPAFSDPFQGFATGGYLYYTDRNTGFSRIGLNERGAVQATATVGSTVQRAEYYAQNTTIPYYGRGISYGAIHTALYKDSRGVWWWAKNYSGVGIYRFKDTDIYKTQKESDAVPSPYPIVLANQKIRAMAIDEERKGLYVWLLNGTPGFYHYNLPGDTENGGSSVASVAMDSDPINTTADEGVYTTQLAVDPSTGYVYFCFRPTATDKSKMDAGIVYYNPTTKKMTHYGEGKDQGLGVCINPNKSKLF